MELKRVILNHLMMRNNSRDRGYWDVFIEKKNKTIPMLSQFAQEITEGESKYIPERTAGMLLPAFHRRNLAMYSRGDDIQEIEYAFELMVGVFEKMRDIPYWPSVEFLSWAVLLEAPSDLKQRIYDAIHVNRMSDALLQGLAGVSAPAPFVRLGDDDVAHLVGALEGSSEVLLWNYLKNWYKMWSDAKWYGSEEDLDNTSYFGYWSVEATAVAKIIGIPRSKAISQPYMMFDFLD